MKASWNFISDQLDRMFFLPFAKNESPEMRALAIEEMLKIYGWDMDQVLDHIVKMDQN